IAEAIDNPALRAASVDPLIHCPAIEQTKLTGKRSVAYARTRRRALSWVRWESRWTIARRKAFRHLSGYATCCLAVIPDLETRIPRLVARDPLTAFPEPKAAEDLTPISDCAFIYGKSIGWIAQHYPEARPLLPQHVNDVTELWDLAEWVDADQVMIGLIGPR